MMTDYRELAGVIENGTHVLPLRIYWEDTDAGGIVYHANYLKFMERGRSDFLRLCGLNQMSFLQETGISLVVGRMDIAFKRPAQLDDVVVVKTCLGALSGAAIVLEQSIWRAEQKLVEAKVTVAAIRGGRPVRLPEVIVQAFAPISGIPA